MEHRQIELDYCTKCEGVWFDANELDLLLQSAQLAAPGFGIASLAGRPPAQPAARPLKCPICKQGMKEVAVGRPAINIDVCKQADGIWFDGGELQTLLRQLADKAAAAGGEGPVFEFLGEVFQGTAKD